MARGQRVQGIQRGAPRPPRASACCCPRASRGGHGAVSGRHHASRRDREARPRPLRRTLRAAGAWRCCAAAARRAGADHPAPTGGGALARRRAGGHAALRRRHPLPKTPHPSPVHLRQVLAQHGRVLLSLERLNLRPQRLAPRAQPVQPFLQAHRPDAVNHRSNLPLELALHLGQLPAPDRHPAPALPREQVPLGGKLGNEGGYRVGLRQASLERPPIRPDRRCNHDGPGASPGPRKPSTCWPSATRSRATWSVSGLERYEAGDFDLLARYQPGTTLGLGRELPDSRLVHTPWPEVASRRGLCSTPVPDQGTGWTGSIEVPSRSRSAPPDGTRRGKQASGSIARHTGCPLRQQ